MDNSTHSFRGDDRGDDISVTSTVEDNEESEEEYTLVRILAERKYGVTKRYLVEWENYPLSNATWEPLDHLNHDTISNWEEFKRNSRRRTALDFKISDWKKAIHDDIRAKRARHDARNRKRLSLGRPTTNFESMWEGYLKTVEESLEDYEEPENGMAVLENSRSERTSRLHESTHNNNRGSKEARTSNARASSTNSATTEQTQARRGTVGNSTSVPTTGVLLQTQKPRGSLARTMADANSDRPDANMKGIDTTVNIFVGGRVRKEKMTLLDAVSDSKKEPKLLKLRHQNLVQKQLRDREGLVAPAHLPSELMSLDSSTPVFVRRKSAATPHQNNVPTLDDNPQGHHSSPETGTAVSPSAQPSPNHDEPAQRGLDSDILPGPPKGENSKKRKRSVHWDDTLTIREAMSVDEEESLFIGQGLPVQGCDPTPATTLEKTNVDKKHRSPEAQLVSKACQFGIGAAQSITVTFACLPEDGDDPWLRHFRNQSQMIFTHACTAQDFLAQAELRKEGLCQGYISETTDDEKVDSIAEQLRIGGLGLLCYNRDYCVIVFSSKSEEWTAEPGEGKSGSASHVLNYSIFIPGDGFEPSMLAPIPFGTPQHGQETASVPVLPVLDLFFEFKSDQLLPPSILKTDRQHFFLAFPPSARQEACLMSQWLRYSHTDCDVRTSLHPGDWSTFVKLDHGTVVLHEDAVWVIRMFPRFAKLLHASSGDFTFWLFRRPVLSTHMLPSLDSPMGGGGAELCRIFHVGIAFLVTPSFLVSQPEQAYNFFKWFWQNFTRNSHTYRLGKLVVCAGIEDWMLNLAQEKSILVKRKAATREDQTHLGFTQQAVTSSFKTWNLVRELASESTDELESPLVFAPDVIDGNDEQSLVNWFGWWTMMNMDRLRKFSVVGSSSTQHPARLSRLVQVPAYHMKSAKEPGAASDYQDDIRDSHKRHDALRLVKNDEGGTLSDFIARVEEAFRNPTWFHPLILYRFPISYWDPDMPFHFQDYTSVFGSYRSWLQFLADHLCGTLEQGSARKRPGVNSCAGFFYTIEGEWDRAKYPRDIKPARRPWIAIFRPTDPHVKMWKSTELLIWDYAARHKYPEDAAVYISDLIDAQRELVKLVEDQSQETLGLPLQQVWLGGLVADNQQQYSQPLDITLNWLEELPPKIRDLLPAPNFRMPGRGWKLVQPGKAPSKAQDGTAAQAMDVDAMGVDATDVDAMDVDAMDVDSPANEVPGTKKVVFHPPRADGQKPNDKCKNRLHEWAEEERRRGVQGESEFVFEPTMKWYDEQVRGGQGCHHINVTSWEGVFARHRIPDPKGTLDHKVAATRDGR